MASVIVDGTEFRSVTHALYQAHMWREYATAWGGGPDRSRVGRAWLENIAGYTREICIARARKALKAAAMFNSRKEN